LRDEKGKKRAEETGNEAGGEMAGEAEDGEPETDQKCPWEAWTAYPLLAKSKPNLNFSRHSRC